MRTLAVQVLQTWAVCILRDATRCLARPCTEGTSAHAMAHVHQQPSRAGKMWQTMACSADAQTATKPFERQPSTNILTPWDVAASMCTCDLEGGMELTKQTLPSKR